MLRCESGRLCVARSNVARSNVARGDVARGGAPTAFSVPIAQVERVLLFGNVQVTSGALDLLLREGVDVCFLSVRGRLKGRLVPASGGGVNRRLAQYERVRDGAFALQTARALVAGKLRNARALLGRHARNHAAQGLALRPARRELRHLEKAVMRSGEVPALLGFEGRAAKVYFAALGAMLRAPGLSFAGRTRHPPRDPVNALLSLGYTLAGNELWAACAALGLDPYLGFLHGASARRPALPLDLLEEFRAPLVDRFTLALLNRRVLDAGDFYEDRSAESHAHRNAHRNAPGRGVLLTNAALKRYLRAWEDELNREFGHPASGRRVSFRRLFMLQAEAMAHAIETGEIYRPYEAHW